MKESQDKLGKAVVYAYVGHDRGVAVDFEGNVKRNEWVKLNLELDSDEVIHKLSWRADDWGSNNIVLLKEDMNRLVGKYMTLCDAMISDKEQREAWKSIIKSTFYDWYDEKFYRYNLEV